MSDPNKTCSNCKHGMSGEQGTKLFCTWEKAHMPPPVFRARLWGENPPVTKDEHAESCAHFEASVRHTPADPRPVHCRERLKDEGKAYPRSRCFSCGANVHTGMTCLHEGKA